MDFLPSFLIIAWFAVAPAAAYGCCHHNHHCGDCADCDDCAHDCYQGAQGYGHCGALAPSSGTADLQTAQGKLAEVDYLPGQAADSGIVEFRLQSAGQTQLIRLAPAGFLKQSGLLLKEGDDVSIKGFVVAGMEGNILVAAEIHMGDKTVSLRDARRRPAW